MKLGVAYYPEHWPESRWATDARLMAQIGLAYVRLGEFAWSLLEPAENRFEFGWLERAIKTLQAENLQVVLGTPTAAAPPWLTGKDDIFQRDQDHHIRGAGSRRHGCANNPHFIRHTKRIVTALARNFGQQQAVIGWQIDNAFGCHNTSRCFCGHCQAAFRSWLRERYGTLDSLNQQWGTVFWSSIYTDWSQVPLPRGAPAQHNPGLQLDFHRFSARSWVVYQKTQVDILRRLIANHQQITHNFMGSGEGSADQQDYYDLSADLDFVSWNNYPQDSLGADHVALNHDMMRGFKHRKYWVMEQQPGVVNWHPHNRPVPPGLARVWTYQGFGHGAEAIIYFRWRAARFGQEQYHTGILRQDGSPTRMFNEARRVARELDRLPTFFPKSAKVAILFDYADWWALQIDPHQQKFSYLKLVKDMYLDLWAAGITVDIIQRAANLDQYQVVLIPAPILISQNDAARWRQFVERGGKLLVTFRAFLKTQSSAWSDEPLPAHLRSLLGVNVDEFLGLPPDIRGAARNASGALAFPYYIWAEILNPTTAEPLLFYNQHYWRDQVAAVKNEVGQGVAVTVGCWFEHMLPQPVWEALGLDEFGLPFEIPANVEAIPIDFEDGGQGLLLLNHNSEPSSLHLDRPAAELLLDMPPTSTVTLQPRDAALFKYG